jgi:hypothetical protein
VPVLHRERERERERKAQQLQQRSKWASGALEGTRVSPRPPRRLACLHKFRTLGTPRPSPPTPCPTVPSAIPPPSTHGDLFPVAPSARVCVARALEREASSGRAGERGWASECEKKRDERCTA